MTPTVNVAAAPSSTAWSVGCCVIVGGLITAKLNCRLLPDPVVQIRKPDRGAVSPHHQVAGGRVEADGHVVAGPPGVSVPPLGEALSQSDVLTSVQVSELVPTLVNDKLCAVTVNGPPTPPMEVKPVPGVITKASGLARALISFCPAGRAPAGAQVVAGHGVELGRAAAAGVVAGGDVVESRRCSWRRCQWRKRPG